MNNSTMKKLVATFLIIVYFCNSSFSQDLFTTKKGTISFFSTTPVENIDASSHNVASAINLKTKQIYFKASLISFEFQSKLMQEHFNENYMESEKYPFAEFSGVIADKIDITHPGSYEVIVEGKLKMHGVVRDYKVPATIILQNKKVSANCQFDVKIADHNIEVPAIVFSKIAEVINIKVHADCLSGTVAIQP